jgi:hypothetical protein
MTLLCLQNIQVLIFPFNTIIARDANIYHKRKHIIIPTLLLPLGHISNTNFLSNGLQWLAIHYFLVCGDELGFPDI